MGKTTPKIKTTKTPTVNERKAEDVRWDLLHETAKKITTMLYNDNFTLLEIDVIINSIWANVQKDKIMSLAMNEIKQMLGTAVMSGMNSAIPPHPDKINEPKSGLYG